MTRKHRRIKPLMVDFKRNVLITETGAWPIERWLDDCGEEVEPDKAEYFIAGSVELGWVTCLVSPYNIGMLH